MNTHDTPPRDPEGLKPVLETLMQAAKKHGASACEAIGINGLSISISVRGGALEDIDNSQGNDIGLRVFCGQRQACVSSSDISNGALDILAQRAVAMAKLAPEDPYCGLANPDALAQDTLAPSLDTYDPTDMSADTLLERAQQIEAAALGVKGVQQAEGANAYAAKTNVYFMTSDGFSKGRVSSSHGLSVSAIASDGTALERDYDYKSARWLEDLPPPSAVGLRAGQRATARLGAKKLKSADLPVLFERRIAGQILDAFISAISGPAIARGVSFLKEDMGKQIFESAISIIDDPLIKRGANSHLWDGEGVACQPLTLVKDGVLQTWLLHSASARQLDMHTTGHALRSVSSPPGVSASNAYIGNGEKSPGQMMADIGEGLYVSEMFGPSINSNTGDYSVGIAGFALKDGVRTHPVNEITIAGNLRDMFKTMSACNDLKLESGIDAPSLFIPNMVIAGA